MRFVNISIDMLMPETVLQVPIFMYEEQSQTRKVVFYAGYTIEEETYEQVYDNASKGALIQISYDDIETFCKDVDIEEDEVEQLNEFLFEMIEKEQYYIDSYQKKSEENIQLKTFFSETADFKQLLELVKAQVCCFPLTISEEVSLTVQIVEKLFIRQSSPIKVAVLAYLLAKQDKISDPKMLSSLLLAGLFQDIGLTQLLRESAINDSQEFDDFYLKHPMLTIYVLSKSGVEFSTLTKRIILEQHEQLNGEGFPRGKKEENIHYLTHYLRAAYTCVYLVEDRYNTKDIEWIKAFDILANERAVEGVNTIFPKKIKDIMLSLKS